MRSDGKLTLKYEIKDNKIFIQLIPDIPEDFDLELLDKFIEIYKPVPTPIKEYKTALQKVGDSFLSCMEKALNNEKNKT